MIYIFMYDIADNRRRNKTAKVLERYGVRMQKSVFQCDIGAQELEKIKRLVLKLYFDESEDSLLIFPLCEKDLKKAEAFGAAPPADASVGEPFMVL